MNYTHEQRNEVIQSLLARIEHLMPELQGADFKDLPLWFAAAGTVSVDVLPEGIDSEMIINTAFVDFPDLPYLSDEDNDNK